MAEEGPEHPVIVFDAECVLCSANAQLVLRNDKRRRFRLASMQGKTGADLLRSNGVDPLEPETLIVVDGRNVLRDSDAVLYIYRRLAWPWRGLGMLGIVPRFLRDPLYRWVARNRYRWFGRREACWMPQPADRDRLL